MQVIETFGGSTSGISSPFTVAEATADQLTVANPRATERAPPAPFTVATFTDADSSSTATDFTATITWGDGSTHRRQRRLHAVPAASP